MQLKLSLQLIGRGVGFVIPPLILLVQVRRGIKPILEYIYICRSGRLTNTRVHVSEEVRNVVSGTRAAFCCWEG